MDSILKKIASQLIKMPAQKRQSIIQFIHSEDEQEHIEYYRTAKALELKEMAHAILLGLIETRKKELSKR